MERSSLILISWGSSLRPPPRAHLVIQESKFWTLKITPDTPTPMKTQTPRNVTKFSKVSTPTHYVLFYPSFVTNRCPKSSRSQRVDDPPDRIKHPHNVGDVCSKTLWVSQRIHGLLSSRGQRRERDQRTGCGRRDAQSLRASEPSIKARGIEMESGALHVRRSTAMIPNRRVRRTSIPFYFFLGRTLRTTSN